MNGTAPSDIAAGFAAIMMIPLLMLGFLLLVEGFWIWMLVHVATNKRLVGNDKLVWVLVVIFANWVGALVYFFAGRGKDAAQRPPPQVPPLNEAPPNAIPEVQEPPHVMCTNCGRFSPYEAFGVDATGSGSCPHCSVHVVFE